MMVAESGFFSPAEPIAGLGMVPAVAERAFTLKDGEVSESIRTPQGFAFITVTGKQDGYVPKLDEVKARAREELLKKKAVDLARQKASAAGPQMKSGKFDAAAKAAGLEVKTTELIARGAPVADIGASPAIDAAAFTLPVGAVSDPIVTDNGAAIVKVLEKKDPAPAELVPGKAALKTQLLNERRTRFYTSYMSKARERMKVTVNNALLAQLVT
jgi:peptidyl-prolyl cis-trans isomerase D